MRPEPLDPVREHSRDPCRNREADCDPSNQFHPYQPQTATPHTEVSQSGLGGLLKKVGMGSGSLGNMNGRQSLDKFRGYAQKNPGAVLGGLAALVIGMGMMRGRR